jgi:hypothetical protein
MKGGLREAGLLLGGILVWLASAAAGAHPTDEELARAHEDRRVCSQEIPAEALLDPVRLGLAEEALRALFGEALTPGEMDEPEGSEGGGDAPRPGAVAPQRLERQGEGDVSRVAYELWEGRVYRIRWRLAPHFERPLLDALIERARTCWGRPEHDQTILAEPGVAEASLRRVTWQRGDRSVEVRQLHPLRGGPLYLTTTDLETVRAMGRAGVGPLGPPEWTGPWWARGAAPVVLAEREETQRLSHAFVHLLAHVDY